MRWLFLFFFLPLFSHELPVVVFDSAEEMGVVCAEKIAELIVNKERPVIGFATGSTPLPLYRAFAKIVKERELDLSRVVTFNLDEYVGLPPEDPHSYHSFMFQELFGFLLESPENPLGIKKENIHIPNGWAKEESDLSEEEFLSLSSAFPERKKGTILSKEEKRWVLEKRALEYESMIDTLGPIDLQILGIGTNGHIGFAEPGSSFDQETSIVTLSENTRKDNGSFFSEKSPPQEAISMGIKSILKAKEIFLLASGNKKASIIQKLLSSEPTKDLPATALKLHEGATLFLDSQAFSQSVVRVINGLVLSDHEIRPGEIWFRGGTLIPPQEKSDWVIDAKGLMIAPGYIDIQINGGFGIDFSTEPEKVEIAANLLPQYGITSFLPTLVSLDRDSYLRALPHLQPRTSAGAEILGVHLEGPFLNPQQCGAHDPHTITEKKNDSLEEFFGSLDGVKIVTLAPEMEGGLKRIEQLRSKGIIVSVGHSNANFDEAEQAIATGASLATHLFNAMAPFHHRNPGIIGAALTNQKISFSLIADGIHLHPSVVSLAWRSHPEGVVLVSDAIEALGLSSGIYRLGNKEIEVKEGKSYITGTETIAGSMLTLDHAVRNFHTFTGCTLAEAIEAASLKPAEVLGLEKKGRLIPGADADFIFLDDQLQVHACFIRGRQAWSRDRNSD